MCRKWLKMLWRKIKLKDTRIEMNKIVFEWCEFCEGKQHFDKSHFYTLFWEDISEQDLKTIFQYFPKSNELFEIMNDYLFGEGEKKLESQELLLELASNDVLQKKLLIQDNIGLVKKIENVKVEYTDDFRIVEESRGESPYVDFFDALNDKVLENWIIEDKKAFALYEAFYGLTKYYEMVWYLFQPLININVSFKYYYKLSKLGGIYSFVDNKLMVSKYNK